MDELVALSGERLSDSTTRLNIRCGLAEVFSKGVAANSQCVLEDLCYLFGLADLNEIDRYDNYSLVDGKMVRDVALDARNKRWHKEIKKAEKAGEFNQVSAMCVGLAHLPGSTGLLPFYFKKGATIKRMDRGGQFTIRAFQDAQNRWIETPEAAVVPLQPQLVPYVAATRTNFNPDRYFALNQDFLNSPLLGAMAVDKRRVWLTDHYFNHGINEKRRWQ